MRDQGLRGGQQGAHVLRRVRLGRGQAVRDGGEAEPGDPRESAGAARPEEAAAVVLRVDEGDPEAMATVEELGQLERRLDVALRRERHGDHGDGKGFHRRG